MRAVIPYIASGFKKDKIWLRRTQPDRRNYQIIVAIDDTLSMRENRSGQLGIEALLVLCKVRPPPVAPTVSNGRGAVLSQTRTHLSADPLPNPPSGAHAA